MTRMEGTKITFRVYEKKMDHHNIPMEITVFEGEWDKAKDELLRLIRENPSKEYAMEANDM